MATTDAVCTVYGKSAQESNSTVCGGCDRRFHLNLRNDVEGKDCGQGEGH